MSTNPATEAQLEMLNTLLSICPDGEKTVDELLSSDADIRVMANAGDVTDVPHELLESFISATNHIRVSTLLPCTLLPGFEIVAPIVVENSIHLLTYVAGVFYQLGTMDKSGEVRDMLKGLTDETS